MLGIVLFLSNDIGVLQIQNDKQKDSSVGISVTSGAFFSELQRSVRYRTLFSEYSCVLVHFFYLNLCIPAPVLKGEEFRLGRLGRERLGLEQCFHMPL